MQFAGTIEIKADRQTVWRFVIDPQQVGTCGPGVGSIEEIDSTHFRAGAKVGIGFISARFVVNLKLVDTEEPIRAVIMARGQAPGSAVDAMGAMHLSGPPGRPDQDGPGGERRHLRNARQRGGASVEGTANRMIGQTFDCMRTSLEA